MTILGFITAFILGALVGSVALARWWMWHTSKPEIAKLMLSVYHKAAHPHWLQPSEEDKRRMCPVCGWTEEKKQSYNLVEHSKGCLNEAECLRSGCRMMNPSNKEQPKGGPWLAVSPNQGTTEPAWVDWPRPEADRDDTICEVYATQGYTAHENAKRIANSLNGTHPNESESRVSYFCAEHKQVQKTPCPGCDGSCGTVGP